MTNPTNTKAYILDLDGTVWDSKPLYASILAEGTSKDDSYYLSMINEGIPIPRIIDQISKMSPEIFERRCRERGNEASLFDGVRPFLERSKKYDISLAVITDLAPWICEPLLDITGLLVFFRTVVHRGNFEITKPDPGVVKEALRRIDRDGDEVIFIGDSMVDAIASRGANVKFAWVDYGYEKPDMHMADWIISSLEEIFSL